MIRFTLAQVLANRLRLALTVVAIMLGVAFVTGSIVLSDTAQRLFDDQFTTASAGADLTVRQATSFDSGMGVEVERDPLAAGIVESIGSVDGVARAVPVAKGPARLERAATDLGAVQLSTFVDAPLGAYPIRDGRAPDAVGEIVIDAVAAGRLGLQIGDTVTVAAEKRIDAELVGLVGFGESDGPPVGTVVLTDLATAQNALALDGDISEVLVTSDLPVSRMQDALVAELGDDVQAASAQDLAEAGAEAAAANLEMLKTVLVAMSVAALLIGSFLIANTFSIVIAQRTRELAVLRATGATGRQVLRSVLAEAAIVGLVASAAGTAAGVAGALGLRGLARLFGVSIPAGDLVVEPQTIVLALVLGTVVTVIAAIGPARRAATVSPVLALRNTAAEGRRLGVGRLITGVLLLGSGSAAALLPTFGAPMLLLALGLALVVAGLVVAGPLVVRPLVGVLGVAIARLGVSGRLAVETAHRAPRRTSSTVIALSLGLALMSFVTIVIGSVKDATGAQYREVVTADVVIESAGQEMLGGVHPEVFDEVAGNPDVDTVARLKYGHWRDGQTTSALSAFDPELIGRAATLRMVDGRLDALENGGILIAERVAIEKDLAVGDLLPMTFARDGEQQVEVVGVVADASAQALQTDYFVSLDTYANLFTEDMDASLFVIGRDGVGPAELTRALEDELDDHPTVQVRDQAAVIEGRTKTVDQIFGLVTVLLVLAMVIAVLGITNTLALSIVERTREIGLLRSVGMSRAGVAAMILTEAALVAAIAAVIGIVVGLGAAYATVGALGVVAPLPMVIPFTQLAVIVAVVVVAGLVAGIAPARRAARLPVLEAIAHA
ncbi:ABC transporter permease [Agromyces sp. NPDC058484]|uniref:ABC transporter permease n=1 Tax=Agromyces sp. NPDC058484 TaxID=3346524 RepID=UPI0036579CEA